MPELLLHHYPTSPFSEKVRLVLGYKRLDWRSVVVPSVLPKPDVMALTGGYRRTPFLQIGADIYCDSALMCRVIDALQPEPPLYPEATRGLDEIVAQWADGTLFWSAVPYTMQPATAQYLVPGATPESMKAFAADRAAMSPNRQRASLNDGAAAVHAYLGRIEHLLQRGGTFLLGPAPCIADFAVVQSVWFMRLAPPIAALLATYPRTLQWADRMQAFGRAAAGDATSTEAIEIAARGERVAVAVVPEPGLEAGQEVSVMPTDYAHDPVDGRLIGLSGDEVVIERDDPRAGTVQVHFPRIGFQIRKRAAA